MNDYLELSNLQISIACCLILLNGGLSCALKLNLGKQLIVASIRTIVQLILVGYVLQYIFALTGSTPVVSLMLAMTIVAGFAAIARCEKRYPGIHIDGLLAMFVSSWIVTIVALTTVVQVRPWFTPQFAIPLLGMILGNTLTGVSLGVQKLTEELNDRNRIEAILCLGGTKWEAARSSIRRAVRTGMVPTINSMMVVGMVSLPGMMTGQLLAGVSPIEAVKYQIVIMFLIAAGTSMGTSLVVLLGANRLMTRHHQLRHDLIRNK